MRPICHVQFLGQVPFQQAWAYQNHLADEIASGRCEETLLLLEHPHTFTFGRRGQSKNLVWSENELAEKGVEVLWVDRGGDVTYHGPGQLVGYPILRLAPIGWHADRLPQADYVGYIRKLEAVLIGVLQEYHLHGLRIEGKTGVWVPEKQTSVAQKIASIGVKVDAKGVSRHGFALNVDPEMSYWEGIIPCGIKQVEMTSMAECLSETVVVDKVSQITMKKFGEIFLRKMIVVDGPLIS